MWGPSVMTAVSRSLPLSSSLFLDIHPHFSESLPLRDVLRASAMQGHDCLLSRAWKQWYFLGTEFDLRIPHRAGQGLSTSLPAHSVCGSIHPSEEEVIIVLRRPQPTVRPCSMTRSVVPAWLREQAYRNPSRSRILAHSDSSSFLFLFFSFFFPVRGPVADLVRDQSTLLFLQSQDREPELLPEQVQPHRSVCVSSSSLSLSPDCPWLSSAHESSLRCSSLSRFPFSSMFVSSVFFFPSRVRPLTPQTHARTLQSIQLSAREQ